VVNRLAPGFAYGSLASGGDILWAEALLRVGAELHVVLPFALEEFVATSVSPAGSDWVQRFNRCLDAASSISYATLDAYLGDEVLFGYCAQLAMGLALLRARFLDAEVCQLALWDGAPSSGVAGTAADVAAWRNTGHKLVVISPVASSSNGGKFGPRSEEETLSPSGFKSSIRRDSSPSRRLVRAMIIGDVRGFSKLTDEKLPVFSELVMGAIAEVLRSYQREIEYRNTWGDALFVMFCDGPSAARCALELQEAMADLDLADACLPPHLALRLSAHIGPVVPITDPVLQVPSFLGSHVNRTARIEPVTPPGAVYVTEAFAAALELARCGDLGFDYVGHMPAAKDYGRLRMYRLRRRRML